MLLDFISVDPAPAAAGMLLNYQAPSAEFPETIVDIDNPFGPPASPFDDNIALFDRIATSWVAFVSLDDVFTLTDLISNRPLITAADTVTLSDASVRTPYKTAADSITLTDAKVSTIRLSKADVFALVDVFVKTVGLSKADAYSLVDAIVKQTTLSKADVITLLDQNTNIFTPGGGAADMTFLRLLLGVG